MPETTTTDAQSQSAADAALDPQLAAWSHSLGVTPEELKTAVAEVGEDPEKVRAYFSARQGAGYDR